MKNTIFLLMFILQVSSLSSCGKNMSTNDLESEIKINREAQKLLDDLNAWDADELAAFNSNESEFLISGEGFAYIEGKLNEAHLLGIKLKWNIKSKQYESVSE